MVVKLCEYRIIMPLKTAEYDVGQLYTVAKMTEEDKITRVKILENNEFVHDEIGNCQKTLKIMNFENFLPGLVKKCIPKDALSIHETSYNAFPKCKTFYKSPKLDVKTFNMSINSLHIDGPVKENVFNLQEDQENKVEVVYINIAENICDKRYDPTNFKNTISKKIHLKKNWVEECLEKNIPIMVCYKLVRIEIDFFSCKFIVKRIINDLSNLLRKSHQRIYSDCDSWIRLNIQDIRKIEKDIFFNPK